MYILKNGTDTITVYALSHLLADEQNVNITRVDFVKEW
jgi:hypothetical protein